MVHIWVIIKICNEDASKIIEAEALVDMGLVYFRLRDQEYIRCSDI